MSDENTDLVVLVDFDADGTEAVAKGVLSVPGDLMEKSQQAIDRAMGTIRGMAARVMDSLKEVSDPPNKVEVSFGIKLDAEAGAMVARAGTEASINVTLTWTKDQKSDEKPNVVGLVPGK